MNYKNENIIIADAEYIDSVAFNLIVNFERMIGRKIPQADMAQWVECIAADGGVTTENKNTSTTVVLVHEKETTVLRNFNPGNLLSELKDQAFAGDFGEFAFSAVAADRNSETMTKNDVIKDVLAAMVDEAEAKRIMVIPNLDNPEEGNLDQLMPVLRHIDRACPEKRVTVFAMQPLTGVPARTEILGYSLMAALGIKASEIK